MRSSILLALLIPVAGLDGGAEESPAFAVEVGIDPIPSVVSGTNSPGAGDVLPTCGEEAASNTGAPKAVGLPMLLRLGLAFRLGPWDGGVLPGLNVPPNAALIDIGIGGGLVGGARPPATLTALLGGPLGGGGVDAEAAGASAPAFLLTHFLSSSS